MNCDRLLTNARLVTLAEPGSVNLEPIAGGVVAITGGRIIYAGDASTAPPLVPAEVTDCAERLVMPAPIDCHTHLIYGGNRADEWQARLDGMSYAELAAAGGGILSTVRATRAAGVNDLAAAALPRLDRLLAEGVTTVEIKSGYGLDLDAERTMLRAARLLAEQRPVRIVTTFLGAHAVPPEFKGRADDYIDYLCDTVLPVIAAEGLADGVDAFCEGIAFSPAQVERLFVTARALGLPARLHADQLSNLGGAGLAARMGALSADHLEHTDRGAVAAMAQAGTVATLLPGAFYFCRETQLPPVAALRAAGVPMAVATDCNPGTSPLTSILLAMNMAATLFGLTVGECWAGVTRHAASALGLADQTGALQPGLSADLAVWDAASPAELIYAMGANPLHQRIFAGLDCPSPVQHRIAP